MEFLRASRKARLFSLIRRNWTAFMAPGRGKIWLRRVARKNLQRLPLINTTHCAQDNMSNLQGRNDVDAARKRLAEAKKREECAAQMLAAAAETLGFAHQAVAALGGGAWTEMTTSAQKTMAFARGQVDACRIDVEVAQKDLSATEMKWREECNVNASAGAGVGHLPTNHKTDGSVETTNPVKRKNKRRHVDESGDAEVIECTLKKAKPGFPSQSADPPRGGDVSGVPSTSFSFGGVAATLPTNTFGFGSATAVSFVSGSSPVEPYVNNAAGKGKHPDEGINSCEASQKPSEEPKQRRIVKACRKWRVDKTAKAAPEPKTSSVFASVKLAPSNRTGRDPASPAATRETSARTDTAANAGSGEKVEEEDVLISAKARRFKRVTNEENEQWKRCESGTLSLRRGQQTSKCRILMHDTDSGKLHFNVGVVKGMTFNKVMKTTAKGVSAYVRFRALEFENKGMETFMLQVKPEFVDDLHKHLEQMAA